MAVLARGDARGLLAAVLEGVEPEIGEPRDVVGRRVHAKDPTFVPRSVAIVGAATSQISYTASKGAVLSLSKELGVQFARQGVRVNALCPGPVETPLLLRIWSETPGAAERRLVHVPMGRMAKPREIVNAALFLASDESSYVNAATFVVDGGLTAAYVTPE